MHHMQPKITASLEEITPKTALRWLADNRRNRKLSAFHVKFMAKDMQNGHWIQTHEGIAFDRNGTLIDGQHRLEAIAESGISQEMFVFRNINPDAMQVIDTGKPRSLTDRMSIYGDYGQVTSTMIATMRFMTQGMSYNGTKMSIFEAEPSLAKHFDAIMFSMDALPYMKHYGTSASRGAVARAYYSHDHEKIRTFCHHLQSGIGDMDALNGIRLLGMNLRSIDGGSRAAQIERYSRTQNVLWHFLHDIPMKSVRYSKENPGKERFILPTD